MAFITISDVTKDYQDFLINTDQISVVSYGPALTGWYEILVGTKVFTVDRDTIQRIYKEIGARLD